MCVLIAVCHAFAPIRNLRVAEQGAQALGGDGKGREPDIELGLCTEVWLCVWVMVWQGDAVIGGCGGKKCPLAKQGGRSDAVCVVVLHICGSGGCMWPRKQMVCVCVCGWVGSVVCRSGACGRGGFALFAVQKPAT